MNVEQFFEKFQLFADAPNAVAKMRELVLDLAVQGKLVEPQVSEGDGHALLERLRTLTPERNSKSRPPKDLPVEPDTRLDIPFHWAITTIENTTRDTGFFCDGDWVESKDQDPNGEVRLIQLADVGDGKYRDRSSRFMTKEAAKRLNCSYLESGDILVARMPDPLGRCCRYPGDSKPAVTVVDVCILRPNVAFFDPDFIVVSINSPRFRRLVLDQATGTTRSRISRSNLGMLPIPLPPLAEQKRIVAKVDELMALSDQLEAQQKEREARETDLARASLARFAEAPTPANLEFIFHKSFDVSPADLRKCILSLAVQGKLVPQDLNDETAESLLNRIDSARNELQRCGIVPKQKPLTEIAEEECEHTIPDTWQWVRLQRVAEIIDPNPSHRMPRYCASGVPFISTENFVGREEIDFTIGKQVDDAELTDQRKRFKIRPGSFALSRIGTIGKTRILPLERNYCMSHALVVIAPYSEEIDSRFLRTVVSSDAVQVQAYHGAKSIGVPDLGMGKIRSFVVPLPPIAEQRRIVAKVDQLMNLVGKMETRLDEWRASGAKLLEAVVAEMVA